jgi:hypothetical protein
MQSSGSLTRPAAPDWYRLVLPMSPECPRSGTGGAWTSGRAAYVGWGAERSQVQIQSPRHLPTGGTSPRMGLHAEGGAQREHDRGPGDRSQGPTPAGSARPTITFIRSFAASPGATPEACASPAAVKRSSCSTELGTEPRPDELAAKVEGFIAAALLAGVGSLLFEQRDLTV